jgi:hypothetical protein
MIYTTRPERPQRNSYRESRASCFAYLFPHLGGLRGLVVNFVRFFPSLRAEKCEDRRLVFKRI